MSRSNKEKKEERKEVESGGRVVWVMSRHRRRKWKRDWEGRQVALVTR